METLRTQKPIARKIHKCDWCGLEIKIGERYERTTHIYDGYIYDWVNHISCRDIAQKLKMFDYVDEGVTGDSFKEFIQDEYLTIIQKENEELNESHGFIIPTFSEQLEFIKNYYNIK